MQSKITPRPGGYAFQLKDYYTGAVPPQDVLEAVQAKLKEMERGANDPSNSESTRSSYRYSMMVLQGELRPVRG